MAKVDLPDPHLLFSLLKSLGGIKTSLELDFTAKGVLTISTKLPENTFVSLMIPVDHTAHVLQMLCVDAQAFLDALELFLLLASGSQIALSCDKSREYVVLKPSSACPLEPTIYLATLISSHVGAQQGDDDSFESLLIPTECIQKLLPDQIFLDAEEMTCLVNSGEISLKVTSHRGTFLSSMSLYSENTLQKHHLMVSIPYTLAKCIKSLARRCSSFIMEIGKSRFRIMLSIDQINIVFTLC